MARATLIALAFVLTTAVAAHPRQPPNEVRDNCRSATDGCRVCSIDEHQRIVGCSFPGFACQPRGWRCNAAPEAVTAPAGN